jgi:hypothetical protein
MRTDSKVVIAGNYVEVLKYGKPISYGSLPQKRPVRYRGVRSKDGVRTGMSLNRAKSHLRRLINANAWHWLKKNGRRFIPIYLTLTFKDNVKDIKTANREYSKFIQRLNYEMGCKKSYLKYVVVIEFQKRGAVHYHMVFFNLPFTENLKEKFLDIWGKGFTKYQKIKNVRNVGRYMTKYMTKDINDKRLYGQKCYFGSNNLKKPISTNNQDLVESLFLLNLLPEYLKTFEKDFESEFCESINYREYDLTKRQQLKETILALFAMVK